MKIAIEEKNAERIGALLRQVNGRAAAHTFTGYDEISDAATAAETHLAERTRLAQSERSGATVTVYSGPSKLPASYNGVPIVTRVRLVRGASKWFLVDVERAEGTRAPLYTLTAAQRDAVVKRLEREFYVFEPTPAPSSAPAHASA